MPLTNPIFRRISRLAEEQGVRAFVVGGYVRDHFLRRPSTDIDVVVVGSGIEIAEALGAELRARVSVFKTFGTAMVRTRGGTEVEFVGARRESYSRDSRKPVVEAGTLEDDQRRRDFTINAMAWSINGDTFGELVDPFGGMDDLEDCTIRTPCDPDITFSDDPLRMMRAVRFAAQLGFDIEPETFEAIRRNSARIAIVSRERIAVELNKIVLSPVPSMGFELLDMTGLLERIFPELHRLKGVERVGKHAHKDNFVHTLKVLDNESKYVDNVNFKGWVFTIMRNIFINNYRRQVRNSTIIDTTEDLYHVNLSQESGLTSPEGSVAVKEISVAINNFSDEYKVPFTMYLAGYKYNEIAEKMSLPLGTVKSRIFFARKRLQGLLKDYR